MTGPEKAWHLTVNVYAALVAGDCPTLPGPATAGPDDRADIYEELASAHLLDGINDLLRRAS